MKFDYVERLLGFGFRVFPLVVGGKTPATDDFAGLSTNSVVKCQRWWFDPVFEDFIPLNVGIYTGDLLALDVDNKGDKNGDAILEQLNMLGYELPETFEQHTPTGGRHLIFQAPHGGVANSVGRGGLANTLRESKGLPVGLDVRGVGGFVVGAGSVVDAGEYTAEWRPVAPPPDWLVERCQPPTVKVVSGLDLSGVDDDEAAQRVRALLAHADPAVEGEGGNAWTFKLACQIKDEGVADADTACAIMLEQWNNRCVPPWDESELLRVCRNAYAYGKEPVGSRAPEALFPDDPIQALNRDFAFVMVKGKHRILQEKLDPSGRPTVEFLEETSFHRKFAARKILVGDKPKLLTKAWMDSPQRRQYEGLQFRPGAKEDNGYYNLFRGFAVEPAAPGEVFTREQEEAVDAWFEHAEQNICHGDPHQYEYLMGYFADIFQNPGEKGQTAVVFKGRKGVGKTAWLNCVGSLLGEHYMTTSSGRYLTSNFNAHFERCILVGFDEAFWSGDHGANSQLKTLITERQIQIERKGVDSFTIDNCIRVVIMGNEDWLVPAGGEDERRYAVFEVGEGRRQDTRFFARMRKGLASGGNRLLLRRLLDWKIDADLAVVPETKALVDQKLESLDALHRWWYDSLLAGQLIEHHFPEWPVEPMGVRELHDAYCRYSKQAGMRYPKSIRQFSSKFQQLVDCGRFRSSGGARFRGFDLGTVDQARSRFEKYIGHKLQWEE